MSQLGSPGQLQSDNGQDWNLEDGFIHWCWWGWVEGWGWGSFSLSLLTASGLSLYLSSSGDPSIWCLDFLHGGSGLTKLQYRKLPTLWAESQVRYNTTFITSCWSKRVTGSAPFSAEGATQGLNVRMHGSCENHLWRLFISLFRDHWRCPSQTPWKGVLEQMLLTITLMCTRPQQVWSCGTSEGSTS